MIKKLLTFIKENILFFVFSFLALAFLIFQKGYWLYVDSAGWPMNIDRYYQLVHNGLNSFSNMTYFGFDSSVISSSRLLQTFTKMLPMWLLYFSFFLFSFLSSYYLLKIKFNKKASFYGALLFTFNPVSLYFLKQVGYLYSYFSLPLIILSIYYFFRTYKIKYIILLLLGILFFISYTRLTGIYLLFLILLGFYYYKFIFSLFKEKKKYIFSIIILIILVALPFLVSFVFPYIDGNKEYFSGLGNYTENFNSYHEGFYNSILNKPFIENFYIKEIVHDFANTWEKNNIFIIFSSLFIILNIFLYLFIKNKNKYKAISFYLFVILLFIIFIKSGAKFLELESFINISYKYFPFIANNINWLYLIYIPIIIYLFSYNIHNSGKNKINLLIIGSLIYIFISIFPLLNFGNNIKTKLVDIDNMSPNYVKTFFTKNNINQSSIFLPKSTLYLKGNPYHIKIQNNNNYNELISNNIRLVNKKQAKIKKNINNIKINNFTNIGLLNLKNIFVFKDVQNVKNGTFDWYRGEKTEEDSKKYYTKLKKDKNLYIKQDNENFAQFGLKNDDKFEYFIYSPAKIIRKDIDDFFKEKINIEEKIVNIDSTSFHKPEKIDNFKIPKENKNIEITYKKSKTNPTKYYLKISNFDKTKPFLIQLNQTFGMSWKLKWIDKKDFENKKCIDKYKSFEITDNKVCNYKSQLLELGDYKYLSKKEIKEKNHFEGNFIGNTWLVEQDDLPKNTGKDLYAVIIYEKQIYYTWALIISLLTFLVLILLSIVQEYKFYFNKK